ncbi:MAG: TonB-dependent siderophore receptor, partial [Alphaproteobacteria bacterium]
MITTGKPGAFVRQKATYLGRMATLMAGICLMPIAASAQTAGSTGPRLQQVAVSYTIPSGSLGSALATFGSRSNLQLLYPSAITRNKTTAGVSGTMAPQEALSQLLAGTGLSFRFTTASTVTISAVEGQADATSSPTDATTLAPIVIGTEQTGNGPVDGYVAR